MSKNYKAFKEIKIPINTFSNSLINYVDYQEDRYLNTKDGSIYCYIRNPRRSDFRSDEEFNAKVVEWNKLQELIKLGEVVSSLTWIDNYIFEATLSVGEVSRGRSSVKFSMHDETAEYEMFAKGFSEMVKTAVINKGKVTGKWCYVKRGANYGIEYLGEVD